MAHVTRYSRCIKLALLCAGLVLAPAALAETELSDASATETFEDWTLRCDVTEQGSEEPSSASQRCQLIQTASAASGSDDVFLLSIASSAPGAPATAVVTLPLGVYLANDIHIYVDGRQAFVLRYEICDQSACYAGFEMQDALVSSWRRGIEARFRVWTGREQAVEFPVSLRGFTAAWAAFEEASME